MPAGAQRGTEVQLSFGGERLEDTQEIICHERGLEVKQLDSVTNKVVKATLKIAPDCALGEHHLRLRTATGISELRTFFVGTFPVVSEKEPNNSPAQAQKIELNATVAGVVAGEDVDSYSVHLKKGELLSAEIQGIRLGRSAFDPRLTLMETNGTVLADVADTWLGMQDPSLSLVAPHDGNFIVQVRETTYAGNGDCHYLLHIGHFSRPTSVFPLGGKAGEKVAFRFFSEATGEFENVLKLPDAAEERFGLFAEHESLTAPTPNWIRVSDLTNVLATGPTPDREHATAASIEPPFALNGIISQKGEEGWFRFPAKKGVQFELQVYARQLRSPLDSVLEVFDSAGHSLASNDDAAGADSSLKFTPSETTNYFVRITDTLGRFGRDFCYRIEVRPPSSSIAVKIPEVSRNDTQSRQFIAVPRGNRFATLISAKRSNFGGELRFDVPELPNGVKLSADVLEANTDSEPLVFEAAADAPIGGRLLDLTATGTNAAGKVVGHFRQDVELVQGPNNTSFYNTSVEKICVAVTKEVPYSIRIVEPKVPLVKGGSMALQIAAERKPGFEEPIEVNMVWNPSGVSSQSEATIPKGATNVVYQLNAGDGAETHTWKIAVLAHAAVDGGQVYVSSQLATLEVANPYLSGKAETLATHPGESAKLTVNLQQLKPFDGKAKIRLMGLPEKITAPEAEVSKDDQKVSFDLTMDPKCQTGSFKNLFCAVEVMANGEKIPHNIAAGGILRVLPVKAEGTKVASVGGKK
ncbi:MAG: peptidase [Verrucomicrobia bacterium]|nr:MAG: peptidase [Verrucomicrobiota bacterium]